MDGDSAPFSEVTDRIEPSALTEENQETDLSAHCAGVDEPRGAVLWDQLRRESEPAKP